MRWWLDVMRWWLAVTVGWMALGGLIGTVLGGLRPDLAILAAAGSIVLIWVVGGIAALVFMPKGWGGERATSPLVETVVPPPVELPPSVDQGLVVLLVCGPILLLLVGGWLVGLVVWSCDSGCGIPATAWWPPGLRAALGRGAVGCAIAVALFAAFGVSVSWRRITCTAQGITVSTRSVWTGLRQRVRVCLWSDVTTTTYTFHRQHGDLGPYGTFAVETSEGRAVKFLAYNGSFRWAYFEEFVAICNARTPHLPYIWVRPPRCPPDYIRVQRDQGFDRDHKVDAYIETGKIPQSNIETGKIPQSNAPDVGLKGQASSNAPDVGITRYYSPDVSHDAVLFALHMLGGARLVWDAYPVSDGRLEIGGLHLEGATGKPVRFGWAARRCEDDAYELANRYSDAPGHYMLDLPSGALTSPRTS